MELYRTVSAKYNPDAPLGSFQQMGFMIGRIIVKTLLDMDPADLDDPVEVNAAIKGIKNFDTHIVCKPWYFGALPAGNVPNNWDYNVVPDGTDTMVARQGLLRDRRGRADPHRRSCGRGRSGAQRRRRLIGHNRTTDQTHKGTTSICQVLVNCGPTSFRAWPSGPCTR